MKLRANHVTAARILLMPLPAILLYRGLPGLYVALAAIVGLALTDWLDGVMARKEGPTVLGGLLDPIADKIFVAICFVPFANRTLPDWSWPAFPTIALMVVFARDFLVTCLRTSLSLRNAPMRTSVTAKYKTAIQMAAVGYLILMIIAQLGHWPSSWIAWVFWGAAAVPATYVLAVLVRSRTWGRRSTTMAAFTAGFAAVYSVFGGNLAHQVLVVVVTAATAISGLSYVWDTWSAMRTHPAQRGELAWFVIEGLALPVAVLSPLVTRSDWATNVLVLTGLSANLAVSGLWNLVAAERQWPGYRYTNLVSALIAVLFVAGALAAASRAVSTALLLTGTAMSAARAGSTFVRYRAMYRGQF